jgi:hypothetical protein
MKRLVWLITLLLVAGPAFAQEALDLGGFLGGDIGDLLNIDAPRGTPARAPARAPARGAAPAGPPVDRLVRLREMLLQQSAPLAKEQEAAINAMLNAEIPVMRQTLARRILDLARAKAATAGVPPAGPPPAGTPAGSSSEPRPMAQPPAAQPPSGATAAPAPQSSQRRAAPVAGSPNVPPGAMPPARGGVPNAVMANLPSPEEIAPDINRLNDQLLGKIAAVPALTPQQQNIITKLWRDQVKSRGGFEALRLTMEEAGAPFTPEQVAQIQPLFDEKEKAKAQLMKDSAGQPVEKAKLDQLDRETLTKVLKLLSGPQRTTLLSPPKP